MAIDAAGHLLVSPGELLPVDALFMESALVEVTTATLLGQG